MLATDNHWMVWRNEKKTYPALSARTYVLVFSPFSFWGCGSKWKWIMNTEYWVASLLILYLWMVHLLSAHAKACLLITEPSKENANQETYFLLLRFIKHSIPLQLCIGCIIWSAPPLLAHWSLSTCLSSHCCFFFFFNNLSINNHCYSERQIPPKNLSELDLFARFKTFSGLTYIFWKFDRN